MRIVLQHVAKNQESLPKVALLDYYITPQEVIIFLIKKKSKQPVVFRKTINIGGYETAEYLNLCVQRLLIDFNGLTPDWKTNRFISKQDRDRMEESLQLNPMVKPGLRIKDPNYPGHLLFEADYKFTLDYLEELSNTLFPADLKESIKDCDLLCLAPHGVLHSLPFHALKWDTNKFIIEKIGICYVPSASTLKYCQAKNLTRDKSSNYEPGKCIVVCSGAMKDYLEFEKDIDILKERKWKEIVPLRAMESKKLNVMNMIPSYDVVHFACHGLFVGDMNQDPLESGLLLTSNRGPVESLDIVRMANLKEHREYFLTAKEIFNVSLSANLVTLRACSSGRATIRSGDELIGLTRAFLYAGSPSLLVSLWNVHIESSRSLLSKFYDLWLNEKKPLQKWKALQQAQIAFIRETKDKYSHPYHWAPFILMGDWI